MLSSLKRIVFASCLLLCSQSASAINTENVDLKLVEKDPKVIGLFILFPDPEYFYYLTCTESSDEPFSIQINFPTPSPDYFRNARLKPIRESGLFSGKILMSAMLGHDTASVDLEKQSILSSKDASSFYTRFHRPQTEVQHMMDVLLEPSWAISMSATLKSTGGYAEVFKDKSYVLFEEKHFGTLVYFRKKCAQLTGGI